MNKQNILYIMCDQFRYDCIEALGNKIIKTPNLDRLVRRGVSYTNAYSNCPVCVPARYVIMTGREPHTTGCFANENPSPQGNQKANIEDRCGEYLPRFLSKRGYRTFGIGKFHTKPDCYEDLGFNTHKHTEELWETPEIKERDAYAGFIQREYPEYAHLDQLHGERTNMYYVPQLSPLPAHLTVEGFVADQAVAELAIDDDRPYFGFVSFVGPHPPCAPPNPYNLLYDPDVFAPPIKGNKVEDLLDEQLSFMNYAIWADDISDGMAKNILSRYYGEITYIDSCVGKILDAVERRGDAENTLICFFSDHGDHMGDHHAWQKESFYESSARIPFLLSAPRLLPQNTVCKDYISLADLFGIAAVASENPELRDGCNILAGEKRSFVTGMYQRPGSNFFKIMYLENDIKYIFMANGAKEQLFDLINDPLELENLTKKRPDILEQQRQKAEEYCLKEGLRAALENEKFKIFDYVERPKKRIHQFEFSKNIRDFTVSSHNFFCAI